MSLIKENIILFAELFFALTFLITMILGVGNSGGIDTIKYWSILLPITFSISITSTIIKYYSNKKSKIPQDSAALLNYESGIKEW